MLLQITYHDKATQTETEEEDTIEKILKAITTLCTKVDSMDNEIQKLKTNDDNLKSKASQQHDYKNAELRRSKDGKNLELKGDDGKLLKTHNVCLNTAVVTSKQISDKQHKNVNLNQLFEKSFTQRTPRHMELRKANMDEVQRWILSLLKPEERPTTRALKVGFISAELLTRYYKLIGHKYPDHICSKCNGEDNIIPDIQLE
ncbi:hypothetical protein H5410_062513 [Solanum commersonii]|uniref:Uncharacterized protein n=1 Tax=Solanum commersonii TaxID=4109 RepID=A0A9J5WAK4_SOLCO|nr:hypothetical protein H5410_062513 [Solanum commersonii]